MTLTQANKMWLMVLLTSTLAIQTAFGQDDHHGEHDDHEAAEGRHGGRLLTDGEITVELAIFEQGVPPEYRAWITRDGEAVSGNAQLAVELERLGGEVDRFPFTWEGNYWQGEGVVEEPHSFDVEVTLELNGERYRWTYPSYEGRVEIAAEIAERARIETAQAGPGEIRQTVTLYGRTKADPARISDIRGRFPGLITSVEVNIGVPVRQGDTLAEIESNQSLQPYVVRAPFSGVITARTANAGELAQEQTLFTLANYEWLWAEMQVFPGQQQRVRKGQPLRVAAAGLSTQSSIEHIVPGDPAHPFVVARAVINNSDGNWNPGLLVQGEVTVAQVDVPLVVQNRALQSFRDWTVVFINVGDSYEVRPLELGRSDGEFTEVLGGLEPGDRYVVGNSYLIKADIEKAGAAHSH